MGNVVAAVDRYQDIPAEVRSKLKARMAKRQYDEIATIGRDGITGKHRYAPEITDMHFGQGTVCRTVTRSKWPEKTVERGLVYCESGHCIIVPTVCRNVSRVRRVEDTRAAAEGTEPPEKAAAAGGPGNGGGADAPAQVAVAQPAGELEFEAPGAGTTSFDDVAQGRTVAGSTGLPSQPAPVGNSGSGWSFGGPIANAPNYGGGGGGGVIGSVGNGNGTLPDGPSGQGPIDMGPLLPGGVPGAATPTPPTDPLPPGPPRPQPGVGDAPPLPGPVTAVPEPGTWALFGLGLAALARRARRR
jgi:hypothetical protein